MKRITIIGTKNCPYCREQEKRAIPLRKKNAVSVKKRIPKSGSGIKAVPITIIEDTKTKKKKVVTGLMTKTELKKAVK